MATQYTSLLGLALPVTGELSGSWGDTVNTAITSLLDSAVSGTTALSVDADVTLTTSAGVANQSRQAIILWNPASGTVTRSITAPAQSKIYTVINASGGTQSIVFRGAGPTTGVTIVKGESAVVAWNGTDFIKVSNTGGSALFTNVTVSGTTTLSGLTASTALALDASKNVVSVANTGTGNNVLATSPTLVTPTLGTPASVTLTNATGLPVATGISGLGTGVATALAVNVGSVGAPVVNGGVLGTPSSGTVTNLTGTASININGTVGATTASTGAFTTLTTSSTVTHNAGTANGVAYLNGSKVLTTGSALTFDGTTFAATANGQFYANGGTTLTLTTNSTNDTTLNFGNFGAASNVAQIKGVGNSNQLAFSANGSEQMRLTSTGLGIGTSSPASKLDVSGGSSTGGLTVSGSIASVRASSTVIDTGDGNRIMALGANTTTPGTLKFIVASSNASVYTTAATIDSSGNLGLGVTNPSSFGRLAITGSATQSITVQRQNNGTSGSPVETQLIGLGGSATGGFAGMYALNSYNSDNASWLAFKTEPAGGGGVVERMRLDSSGNLGLGVTPSGWHPATDAFQFGTSGGFVSGRTNGTAVEFGSNAFRNAASNAWIYTTTAPATLYEQNIFANGAHVWYTAPSGTAGNAISFTQAMTLNASGNLGIGTTSPTQRLEVSGAGQFGAGNTTSSGALSLRVGVFNTVPSNATDAFVGVHNTGGSGITAGDLVLMPRSSTGVNNNIVFLTGQTTPTIRATIDTSGNFGIGTSSPTSRLDVATTTQFNFDTTSTAGVRIGTQGTVGGSFMVQTPSLSASFGSGLAIDGTYSGGKSTINLKAFGVCSGGPYSSDLAFFTSSTTTLSERMRLDSSGNLGLGVTPSAWAATIRAAQVGRAGALWSITDGNVTALANNARLAADYRYIANGFAQQYRHDGSGNHIWETAPSGTAGNAISFTQAMTLSANQKLTIGATATDIAVAYLVTQSAADVDNIRMAEAGITSQAPGIRASGDALAFKTTGTERARIDSSGNLGLGVTPSAWTNSFGTLQSVNWAVSSNGANSNSVDFISNAFRSGGVDSYVYIGSSNATRYKQIQGAHQFFTAPSGTAGNAISFTQAMTLNASGNLFIGTTSGTERINVANVASSPAGAEFAGNGNVIGTASLFVGQSITGDGFLLQRANQSLIFGTNATERARITSGGEFLVGTSASYGSKQTIYQNGNAEALWVIADNASFTDNVLRLDCSRNTTNGTYNFLECTVPGITNRLFIRDSGNVVNANNSYGAISDAKLKENVTDATPKLEKLQQVRVVNYNLIGEEQKQIGVIAQELEQVFPGMVEEAVDRDTEGNDLGTTTKSVKYSVFVPMLIKAMQEQQALITTLTARVAALESN